MSVSLRHARAIIMDMRGYPSSAVFSVLGHFIDHEIRSPLNAIYGYAQLMEAAGTALAEAVAGLAPQGPVRIVCGKGNNGGDGLVAARHLRGLGFEVETLELEQGGVEDLDAWLAGAGAIVDAIFGTGFKGVPREPAAEASGVVTPSSCCAMLLPFALSGCLRPLLHRVRPAR